MRRIAGLGLVVAAAALWFVTASRSMTPPQEVLRLHTRSRATGDGAAATGKPMAVEKTIEWEPRKTALIICDMWDDHWCRGAARRVVEMAGPLNKVVHRARDMGVLVIHAPSTCVDFYKDTPQRRRAQAAPFAKPPVAMAETTRWGTRWCWPDPQREPALPIDDSDMGCDCPTHSRMRIMRLVFLDIMTII
jgi:hypothetical protein